MTMLKTYYAYVTPRYLEREIILIFCDSSEVIKISTYQYIYWTSVNAQCELSFDSNRSENER